MNTSMVFQRYELKYLMTRQQQQAILAAMEPYMQADSYGLSSIRSLYFDTPDFLLIRRSLEHPLYKEKLRLRSYGQAGNKDMIYAELKKKYQGVVYKRRIALPQQQALACLSGRCPMPDAQIGREIQYTLERYGNLAPAVFLSYDRTAYYMKDGSDFRVTFDRNIRFREENLTLNSDDFGSPLLRQDMLLMELKTSGAIPLWMARVLSRCRIYKTSFSKYGTAYQMLLSDRPKGLIHYA